MEKMIRVNKGIISILAFCMAFVFMATEMFACTRRKNIVEYADFAEKIYRAPCAKFERKGEADVIFIDGEIATLSVSTSKLDLVSCDIKVEEWIYRITFNCKELNLDDNEIIMLVGENSLSVNGYCFTAAEGVPFGDITNFFESKYTFFKDNLKI